MKLKKSLYFFSLYLIILTMVSCETLRSLKLRDDIVEYSLNWQGFERQYLVHFPPEEKMQDQIPVLFHLHGGGGTASGTVGLTFGRFNELADRDGFIMIYPQAIEKNWNDGRKSDLVFAWKENIDDVGFIAAIIDELKKEVKVDEDRIFTAGMSNGGFMSMRLLCDRADIFRGGAILTATLSEDYLPLCNPDKPTAVMIINGTDDSLVPYDGGEVMVLNRPRGQIVSTDEIVEFWKEENDCITKKPIVHLPDIKDDGTTVSIEEYTNCNDRGSLVLYKIEGGGHTWPGGRQYFGERLIGKTSQEFVACDVIWNYFKSLE